MREVPRYLTQSYPRGRFAFLASAHDSTLRAFLSYMQTRDGCKPYTWLQLVPNTVQVPYLGIPLVLPGTAILFSPALFDTICGGLVEMNQEQWAQSDNVYTFVVPGSQHRFLRRPSLGDPSGEVARWIGGIVDKTDGVVGNTEPVARREPQTLDCSR